MAEQGEGRHRRLPRSSLLHAVRDDKFPAVELEAATTAWGSISKIRRGLFLLSLSSATASLLSFASSSSHVKTPRRRRRGELLELRHTAARPRTPLSPSPCGRRNQLPVLLREGM
jgi:hypothetical protein